VVIALDSSIAIPWFDGRDFPESQRVRQLAGLRQLVMPGVTLVEVLCGRAAPPTLFGLLAHFPVLPVTDGHWARAGALRQKVLRLERKARLGDTLIAQACIDAGVPLLTRDLDFQVFAEVGGLVLA